MSMISYNEVLPKKVILLDGEPYEVISAWVFRKQQRKPVNQTKLRNLKTGSTTEYTFHQPDKIEEAEIETHTAVFIFSKGNEWWFHEDGNTSKRFMIPAEIIGDDGKYLKANTPVDVRWFDEQPIQIKLPIKMEFKVKEAPPNVRGNTSQGGYKLVTLETGAAISVPMFINEGDTVRINTETHEYVERA